MENKDDSFLSKSDSPQNGLRTQFDLVDDYQENGGVNGTPPKLICPNVWDMRIQLVDPETGEPIKREDLVKAMQDVDLEEAYPGTRKTNPELYSESVVGDYRKMYPTKAPSLEESMESGLGDLLDGVKENPCASAAFINPGSEEVHDKAIKEHKSKKRILLDHFNRDHGYLLGADFDADEFSPRSPYPSLGEFTDAQIIGLRTLLRATDLWGFYRHHAFREVHHKRRKAHFDGITLTLLQHGWDQYKEALHKKKFHIFDKTPRAKAGRLALKRSKEKIKSTLMIS